MDVMRNFHDIHYIHSLLTLIYLDLPRAVLANTCYALPPKFNPVYRSALLF